MAAAMAHIVEGPDGTDHWIEANPDLARLTVCTDLAPGRGFAAPPPPSQGPPSV